MRIEWWEWWALPTWDLFNLAHTEDVNIAELILCVKAQGL